MRSPRYNLRGFTLVEVVLVLVIIAVCAMIAAPKLADFARGRVLPNAAVDLATTARWCRVMALQDGTKYRLNFDPSAGTYWVTKDDGTGVTYAQVTAEDGKLKHVPDGVGLSCPDIPTVEDGIYVTFEPGGQSDVARIALSTDSRTLNVQCETPLGLFRVYDPVTQRILR